MITVVDYKAGNTFSVMQAFERLGKKVVLTADPDLIYRSQHVIFPGVGSAKSAMDNINERELKTCLQELKQPFLGVCLGMQMLLNFSEEGNTTMLNIVPEPIEKFKEAPKIPHMGWNSVYDVKGPLFKDISSESDFYFVHSYRLGRSKFSIANCSYGEEFSAAINYKNYFGLQFHPEKSSENGSQILKNFLAL